MDPVELEYIGEKEEIGVIPNFNFDPIHLISGTIGKEKCLIHDELINNYFKVHSELVFLCTFHYGSPFI